MPGFGGGWFGVYDPGLGVKVWGLDFFFLKKRKKEKKRESVLQVGYYYLGSPTICVLFLVGEGLEERGHRNYRDWVNVNVAEVRLYEFWDERGEMA